LLFGKENPYIKLVKPESKGDTAATAMKISLFSLISIVLHQFIHEKEPLCWIYTFYECFIAVFAEL